MSARPLTANDADTALFVEFVRRHVSIADLKMMYRCTKQELDEFVAENFPNLICVLALCPEQRSRRIFAEDTYPPVNYRADALRRGNKPPQRHRIGRQRN